MYLARIQDVRDFLLDDLYGIAPCSLPPLDTLVDTCFQYSILVNMLLVSITTTTAVSFSCTWSVDKVLIG